MPTGMLCFCLILRPPSRILSQLSGATPTSSHKSLRQFIGSGVKEGEKPKYFLVFGLKVLLMAKSMALPCFFSHSAYTSFMSTTCSSYNGAGQLKRNRLWPCRAATSAAARALIPALPMLSTVTSVLFLSPHSLTYFSLNHLSKAGTKCTHWRIFRLFLALAP